MSQTRPYIISSTLSLTLQETRRVPALTISDRLVAERQYADSLKAELSLCRHAGWVHKEREIASALEDQAAVLSALSSRKQMNA